jgi:DNA-binding MarR family transcriptional regulator
MARKTPSTDQARRLTGALRALARRFALSERDEASCCGITRAQAATLSALRGERVRLGALGKRLGITPSTLTRNLARLEEQGLVERIADARDGRACCAELTVADARDGRACCAELTDSGRRAERRFRRRDDAFAVDVLARLPEQRRERTLEALDELLLAVREATESCCGGAFDHLMKDFPERRTG